MLGTGVHEIPVLGELKQEAQKFMPRLGDSSSGKGGAGACCSCRMLGWHAGSWELHL